MSVAAAEARASTGSRGVRPYTADQTFLPAALEILETPASPVSMGLLLLICGFVTVALIWASVGRLDVIASAQGRIVPVGKVKVIQPLQTGKVLEILVQNGDPVAPGQVVARLDDRELESQFADQLRAFAALSAEAVRRRAAITAVMDDHSAIAVPSLEWPQDLPAEIKEREQKVLQGDLDQLSSLLDSLQAQIAEKSVEQASLAATIDQQSGLIQTLKDRAAMRQTLVDKEAGSKSDWLDSMGSLKVQQVALTEDVGRLAASKAASVVLMSEVAKTRRAFIDDNLQKLADAERQADALGQKVKQAQVAVDQMTLRSPIAGNAQGSLLTSVGQVVTTGEEVMRIVPVGAPVEVEAYLPNADVGFVRVGQKAEVKIDAFPFTRYGTISGRVVSIGTDAIPAADAQQSEADTARPGAAPLAGGAQHTTNLVFPVTVALDKTSISADGADVNLAAGMGVTAEVDTGSRTILEYLFSPLVETARSAMRER